MSKTGSSVKCPFCLRDAGVITVTKRQRQTFYCGLCRTRIFVNTYVALKSLKKLCEVGENLVVGETGYEEN